MILSWMLYSCTVALLFALAAWALESVVRQRGWPVRGLWSLALLGALLLPILPSLLPSQEHLPAPADPSPGDEVRQTPAAAAPMGWVEWTEPLVSVTATVRTLDFGPWLLALWGITSATLLLTLGTSYRTLVRRRRGWNAQQVDGHTIWVSPDTGPAVVGFLPGRIQMQAVQRAV